jgi:hypothetical protein
MSMQTPGGRNSSSKVPLPSSEPGGRAISFWAAEANNQGRWRNRGLVKLIRSVRFTLRARHCTHVLADLGGGILLSVLSLS